VDVVSEEFLVTMDVTKGLRVIHVRIMVTHRMARRVMTWINGRAKRWTRAFWFLLSMWHCEIVV
jgi:hypothetical protein